MENDFTAKKKQQKPKQTQKNIICSECGTKIEIKLLGFSEVAEELKWDPSKAIGLF